MAYLQLLKSTPSNSQTNCFCSKSNSMASLKRSFRLQNSGVMANYRKFRVSCKIENTDKQTNGEEPPESLFMKELKRRGMTPTSLLEEKKRSTDRDEEIKFREEDGGRSYSRRNGISNDAETETTNLSGQREKSMALNSEGLEGLIPRGKLLLTLGGTFFLAFWPLILVTVAFFSALYLLASVLIRAEASWSARRETLYEKDHVLKTMKGTMSKTRTKTRILQTLTTPPSRLYDWLSSYFC